MNCIHCGTAYQDNQNFCRNCGAPVSLSSSEPSYTPPAYPQPPSDPYASSAPPSQYSWSDPTYSQNPSPDSSQNYSQNYSQGPYAPPYAQPYTHQSPKSRLAALLLCVFLGGFGIHRFYVGKIGTGLLYLFTGGLFGFGWIIDIILIAIGSFCDKDDRFLLEW